MSTEILKLNVMVTKIFFLLDAPIYGVIVLAISNQPRASHSSDFEITRLITP